MRKGLPLNGGRPFAFRTGKARRGYPSPGFSGLIVSKFSYLISTNIFSSAAATPTGSHGRYLYQAAVRAVAALQDKGGIGLPIRLFTGTAAGLRGRKDDYGGFVLLAPDTGDPIPVEVMRMVSAQLIEEPELIERLRTGQRDAAV
jgi:hypothetical protein